jgi:hypothetical protein
MQALRNWLRKVLHSNTPAPRRPNRTAARPSLELLETRTLLSTGLDLAPLRPLPTPEAGFDKPVIVAQHPEVSLFQVRQAATTTTPTADSLSWANYRRVTTSPSGFDAYTAWTWEGSYGKPRVTSNTYRNKSKWVTCAVARVPGDAKVTLKFDAAHSYVVSGKESSALLAHETLHLRIAEYVAAQAKSQLLKLFGYAAVTHANKAKSKALAEKKAVEDLKRKIAAWNQQWGQIDKAVTNAYDTATSHYTNAAAQADWQANWQSHIDPIIQNTWH